jgi:hypothetical protein
MESEIMSYQDVNDLLNIKESDLEILETRITPYADSTAYFNAVDADYNAGKVIPISAMEYKNMVMMEYFLQQIFASGIDKWVNYIPAKSEAIKSYQMTWNIANKTVDKMQNKKEEKSKIILAK